MSSVPEQFDLLTALDEAQGLAPWFETDFRTPSMTTAELARRHGCGDQEMRRALADEERLGHVERDGNGGWRVSSEFLAEYGRVFRDLSLGRDEAT